MWVWVILGVGIRLDTGLADMVLSGCPDMFCWHRWPSWNKVLLQFFVCICMTSTALRIALAVTTAVTTLRLSLLDSKVERPKSQDHRKVV